MTPLNGSSLGLRGGSLRWHPGGVEHLSILRAVSRCSPNTLAASRMLIPSTCQARRTQLHNSTVCIPSTFSQSIVLCSWVKVSGGPLCNRHGRSSPPLYRDIISPPFIGDLCLDTLIAA